ncbi:MAG TPA: glycosyltransferase family 4 protein, partial [Actinomycetota bacterium]|nr:glycosyltransferase family 4 protein [Actinomycetota bacterium]
HGPLHLEAAHTRAADLATRGPLDFYIATSRATEAIYRRLGIPAERMTMVYSGSHTDGYVRPRTNELRRELGLGDDTPLVGMIAWMYPPKAILAQRSGLKGHDVFLRSIPLILARHPDARFAIVGGELSGGERYATRLRTMASEMRLDDVLTFVGPRDDVPRIQPDFDVVVHPSRSENPGGAVYTLLGGIPTVGTRVGGIPEIVRDDETGLLVPPEDHESLAAAVDRMLADPAWARATAARGRELARSLFDISVTAPRVAEFYDHVVRFGA